MTNKSNTQAARVGAVLKEQGIYMGSGFIKKLIEAAQPTPEPVAQRLRQMTDDEITTVAARHLGEMHVENCGLGDIKAFARAIEAHHGIKATGASHE